MCQPISDRKSRRLLQIGSICLVLALLSQALNLSFGLSPIPLHFLRGLLLGVAIVTNLAAVRLRCRPNPS